MTRLHGCADGFESSLGTISHTATHFFGFAVWLLVIIATENDLAMFSSIIVFVFITFSAVIY